MKRFIVGLAFLSALVFVGGASAEKYGVQDSSHPYPLSAGTVSLDQKFSRESTAIDSDSEVEDTYRQKFDIEFNVIGKAPDTYKGDLFKIGESRETSLKLYYRRLSESKGFKLQLERSNGDWLRYAEYFDSEDENVAGFLRDGKEYKVKINVNAIWVRDRDRVGSDELRISNKITFSVQNITDGKNPNVYSADKYTLNTSGDAGNWTTGYIKHRFKGISGNLKIIPDTNNAYFDIFDFKITDHTGSGSKTIAELQDKTLNISSSVEGSSDTLTLSDVGLDSYSTTKYRYHKYIDLSAMKTELSGKNGNNNERYRLVSVTGTGSANAVSSSNKTFFIKSDSNVNLKWKKQYKLQLSTVGNNTSSAPKVKVGGQEVTPESGVIWVDQGKKVEVVTPKSVSGLVLQKSTYKGQDSAASTLTASGSNYVIKLTDSMKATDVGELKLVYDERDYALKVILDIPQKLDGTPAFANSYADIGFVANNQKEATIKRVAGTEIDPSVKGVIYDPNNANLRYKLVSITGTGSASSISKNYTKLNSHPFTSFKLNSDSTLVYKWVAQHKLNLKTSRSAAKNLPVVIYESKQDDQSSYVLPANKVAKSDLGISFDIKGKEWNKGEALFSISSPSNSKAQTLALFYYSEKILQLVRYDKVGSQWLGYWDKNEIVTKLKDSSFHKIDLKFKKDTSGGDLYNASLVIDGISYGNAKQEDGLKAFIAGSDYLEGQALAGNILSDVNPKSLKAYSGEIKNFRIYSQATPTAFYNDTAVTLTGANEYWIDDGATVKLLVPKHGVDNLVSTGFTLTQGVGSLPESRDTTEVDYNGEKYLQINLTNSMTINDSGTATWNYGTKIHQFKATIGQPFTLDKAEAGVVSDALRQTTEQVADKVLQSIQGASHKPSLFAAVEKTPAASTEINAMVFTSKNPALPQVNGQDARDIYKGQIYFTRPGKYRLEWLLGGTDFPIEGSNGIPKLVAEVVVDWPKNTSGDVIADYQHIAETPDVPLDTAKDDNLAFKEMRLVQLFKKEGAKNLVPDYKANNDITVSKEQAFSFPKWNGTNTDNVYRSVLLFTRSSDPNSVATGDIENEEIVVKVVESRHWSNTQKISNVNATIGQEITNAAHTATGHNGYILYTYAGTETAKRDTEKARYNIHTYDPETRKGQIFAVNQEAQSSTKAKDKEDDLVVAWYSRHEESYSDSSVTDGKKAILNWPSTAIRYLPQWPTSAADKANVGRIVISSRLGSDGLDAKGKAQLKFDAAKYTGLTVYNQPDKNKAGYNPNEEHALVKTSYRYRTASAPPKAVYALRVGDLNKKDNTSADYTSHPYVLAHYQDTKTKAYGQAKYGMKLYQVVMEDANTLDALSDYEKDTNGDGKTDANDLATYDTNQDKKIDKTDERGKFRYTFDYPIFAGDKVLAPYPINEVIGASTIYENTATNPADSSVYWEDKNGTGWAVAGDGKFTAQYWYPMQDAFWHPLAKAGDILPLTSNSHKPDLKTYGKEVAKADGTKEKSEYFISDGNAANYSKFTDTPTITYSSYWKANIPEIRIGETLTFAGGEEKKDNSKANGLPGAIAWASAEVVYDGQNKTANVTHWADKNKSALRVKPAVREISIPYTEADFPDDLEVSADGNKRFIKALHGGLKQRIYFDRNLGKLVLRGILNDKFAGDPELTKDPGNHNYMLQPNVLTQEDLNSFYEATEPSTKTKTVDSKEVVLKDLLRTAFAKLYALSLNPTLTTADLAKVKGKFESGAFLVKHDSKALKNLAGLSRFLRDQSNRYAVLLSATNTIDAADETQLKALLPNNRLPTGLKIADLELVEYKAGANSPLPHNEVITDSVTLTALKGRDGKKAYLVRIRADKGYLPAAQVGTGLALFTNPNLLNPDLLKNIPATGSHIVIAENNLPGQSSPIALHIMKLNKRPYRGQIKTVLSDNVFDEKLVLRHTGDFAGDANDLIFEWKYRETGSSNNNNPPADGTATNVTKDPSCPNSSAVSEIAAGKGWQAFADDRKPTPSTNGLGRNELVFGKSTGKDVLVDNDFFVRYRHKDSTIWSGWGGAGNNLPCEGKPVYKSQLVKGWIKRVTDRVNEFDTRITQFSANAPATYVSMIEQAGQPYKGDVALNPSKNVIENVGLIELYRTVLNRAESLSINAAQPAFTQGVGIALQNAANRISKFYVLLGNEAYTDALDPTIGFNTDSKDFGSLAPTVFTFQNMVSSLAEEELALLRGRTELGGQPVHNRLIWNYANSTGESVYNLSYNVTDRNKDGNINEKDAKQMYPQGHGDAWGHYLSATEGFYTLLRHKEYQWVPRSEKYEIDGVTLNVDYLDERTFAEAAAAKAKVGNEVVSLTYRQMYEEDPDGQWQGYKDTDAKAWGVDGWVKRVHLGSYFDWMVAHAILPAEEKNKTGIQKVDRTTVPELQEISINGNEILTQLAQINNGQNPLGLLPEVVPFDIEPDQGKSHFEQVYARAEEALAGSYKVFNYANELKHRIRKVADTQEEFSEQVYAQDREYRNRSIEIFGTPYDGVIGAGKQYPEGYDGPDVYFHQYIDVSEISEKTLPKQNATLKAYLKKFGSTQYAAASKQVEGTSDTGDDVNNKTVTLFKQFYAGDFPPGFSQSLDAPSPEVVNYPLSDTRHSMTAPSHWGKRNSPGQLQSALIDIVKADVEVRLASKAYTGLIDDLRRIEREIKARTKLKDAQIRISSDQEKTEQSLNNTIRALNGVIGGIETLADGLDSFGEISKEALPKTVGLSNDVTSVPRSAILIGTKAAKGLAIGGVAALNDQVSRLENSKDVAAFKAERETIKAEYGYDIKQQLREIDDLLDGEPEHRLKLFKTREVLRQAVEKYRAILGKGNRLLEEREAFNKKVASKTQSKRYQDMAFRLNRTAASQKYRASFDLAAKYAYLAAKAYDYETNLSPKDAASAQHILKDIVQARTLGQVEGGEPVSGQGGLADVLARMNGNFKTLKTQMGFNNPQIETEPFSLRQEKFRIKKSAANNWKKTLNASTKNLWEVPEFKTHMRPFSKESNGDQSGLVIEFGTEITSGKNFFGKVLGANDHAYDPSQFSTRIQSVGVWFEGYRGLGLAETARAYLVPLGQDIMYVPNSLDLDTREWTVYDQKIPAPLPFSKTDLESAAWFPTLALSGPEGQIRRHSQLRVYHDSGTLDASQVHSDSRLYGRSVWNNRWLLVIPGAGLLADPEEGIRRLIYGNRKPGVKESCKSIECYDGNGITDIKLVFKTYAYSGN